MDFIASIFLAKCSHVGFVLGLMFIPKGAGIFYSETSVDFQLTVWHYIPEENALQTYSCENLKS